MKLGNVMLCTLAAASLNRAAGIIARQDKELEPRGIESLGGDK